MQPRGGLGGAETAAILKPARSESSASSSDKFDLSLPFPNTGAHLFPANKKGYPHHAIQTLYATTRKMRCFKPYDLLFGSLTCLLDCL